MVSEIETAHLPRPRVTSTQSEVESVLSPADKLTDLDQIPPEAERAISAENATALPPSLSSSVPLPIALMQQLAQAPLLDSKPWRTVFFIFALLCVLLISGTIAHLLFAVPGKMLLVVGVVITALGFDFVNGMNDSGNAIATVISTRALPPVAALIMAAILNLAGALLMEGVAKSIAGKIVLNAHASAAVTPLMVLCGLIGAIIWAYNMARIGMPISMSHSLIGGLVGVLMIAGIHLNFHYLGGICMWMVIAPVMGITFGWLLMVGIMWVCRNISPYKMNHNFRFWQILSSAAMAFMHGSNDAQKAMGIITLALVAGGIHVAQTPTGPHIPLWVKLACATVIALGTGIGGKRVIGTIGHKIFKLTPVHGFAAETVASGTILLATMLNVPISTTHVISSSVLGVGSSKRLSAVRWGVAGNIISAWLFTIPTCGLAAALLYGLLHCFGFH